MRKKEITTAQKSAFIEAMTKSFGNVTQSARAVGVARTTPYKWASLDPEFARNFNSDLYSEMLLDAIDAKLVKLAIQDENPTVLIFLAKTKGKKRGYIERTEQEVTATLHPYIDYTRLSESALREIAEQVPELKKETQIKV